ncbi:MAG: hypothetical protein ABI806_25365 [Candidatus Solibacter sp.]
MSILKPQVPAAAEEAFSTQLADFVWPSQGDRPRTITQEYVGEMPRIPSLSDLRQSGDAALFHDAHHLYVLDLRDVADNADVISPRAAGWRFFAGNSPGNIVMATVKRKGDNWRMTSSHYGERVWEMLEAVRALDQMTELEGGKYEVRVLTVPGLNLEVFWLTDKQAGTDLAVPFPAPPKQPIEELNKYPVYTMTNFLAAIRPLARQRLAAGSKYGG